MQHHHTSVTLVSLVLCLATVTAANAARPGGGGGKTVPDPDIIYMSDDGSTQALSQGAVRGIDIAADGSSGSDLSLLKSKSGRQHQAVAWSPDGKRAAWYEIGLGMVATPQSIVVAAPGAKPVTVYTSAPGDGRPQLTTGTDSLAWGPVCGGGEESMLVFASHDPAGIYGIRFVGNQPGEPELLMSLAVGEGLWIYPSAFAFSPAGEYLAFAGSGSTGAYGVWALPMCPGTSTPFQLLTRELIAGEGIAPVISIDWSRHGDRLAMSVVTGADPAYDWRDLKIVYLNYLNDGVTEQVTGYTNIVTINLDQQFTTASSEHSPQWGPAAADTDCQRIAFSQSSAAGRRLYLLDIGSADRPLSCDIYEPQLLGAKWPRALDWR